MSVTVAADGSVKSAKAISGPVELRGAAEQADMQWEYAPYLLNGKPVELDTKATVHFRLPPALCAPTQTFRDNPKDLTGECRITAGLMWVSHSVCGRWKMRTGGLRGCGRLESGLRGIESGDPKKRALCPPGKVPERARNWERDLRKLFVGNREPCPSTLARPRAGFPRPGSPATGLRRWCGGFCFKTWRTTSRKL